MCLDLFYSSRRPLHWRSCQNFKIRNSLGDTATLHGLTLCAKCAKVRHIRQPDKFQLIFKRLLYHPVQVSFLYLL